MIFSRTIVSMNLLFLWSVAMACTIVTLDTSPRAAAVICLKHLVSFYEEELGLSGIGLLISFVFQRTSHFTVFQTSISVNLKMGEIML
jgi:hypothetical protein